MSNRRKLKGTQPSVALTITGNNADQKPDRTLALSSSTDWRAVTGPKACYGCYFDGQENDPYIDAWHACTTDTGGVVFLCGLCLDNWKRGLGQYRIRTTERITP